MKKNKSTFVKLLKRIKKHSFFIIVSLIMAAVTVATTLYVPILVGRGIDCIIGVNNVDFAKIVNILIRIGIFVGITALSQWLMNICNNRITYEVTRDIRNEAIEKIQVLPLKYIDGHSYGEIVSRVIADVDQFADGLLMGFTQFFTGVMTILGTLIFMITISAKITLAVVVITPLSFLVASFIAKKIFSMFKLQSETRGEQTALIDEMIGGQKVVKAYGYEDEAVRKFDEINERLQKYSLKAIFFSSITNPSTRFVNSLVYASVAIVGAFSAINGGITVGQLSSFLSYANQYTKPFNEISGVVTELQNALACAARIFELIEEEPEIPDTKDAKVVDEVDGTVDLNDVCFSYVPDKKLIEGFNLHVKKGQRIAIVGPTGCGKTTVINLLMRFYDVNSGSIDVSGTDIRQMTRKSLRQGFGMVLQETWLKSGTIRENIVMGKPDATDEEIYHALEIAQARDFVDSKDEGLDLMIQQGGKNLSGGQKQRLTIARALVRNPEILVLDDSASALDFATDAALRKAIRENTKDMTVFLVSQRATTIKNADQILVLDDGNLVGRGTHKELLDTCEVYREICFSQLSEKEVREHAEA